MKVTTVVILICFIITLPSCFKQDQKIIPKYIANDTIIEATKSMYDYQSYFDLGTIQWKSIHPNTDWIIEFDCRPEGWTIRINSSAFWEAYPTGDTIFTNPAKVTSHQLYKFDAVSGDPDSTAMTSWLNRAANPAVPTHEVFLIGKFDGIKDNPVWKLRINNFTDSTYSISFAPFSGGNAISHIIHKDNSRTFEQFDFSNGGQIVDIEPQKDQWDLFFTQYESLLPDGNLMVPYFVRGVLLNPYNTSVAIDSVTAFQDINYEMASKLQYSSRRNIIGYDWKSVKIDYGSNTAEYFVKNYVTYLIKDSEGFIYKFRFIDFYNESAVVGYPTFEFIRL